MAETAATQAILIISADDDFAHPLAEQLHNELGLKSQVVATINEAKQYLDSALMVVSTSAGDDYFPCPAVSLPAKPFKMKDLLDDIDALRHNQVTQELALGQGLTLQIRQKLLRDTGGKSVALTDKELQLVQILAPGELVGKEQLLKNVWGIAESVDTHTLETHMYRLRGKLRELREDDIIEAVEGGYKWKL